MVGAPSPVDYKPKLELPKTVSPASGGTSQPVRRSGSATPAAEISGPRPEDFDGVEACFHLLARATRQFHTYPATSPLCTDAVAACHKAFMALHGRDGLTARVTPTELIVDNVGFGAHTIIEHELVSRLHRSHVGSLDFDRLASPRDFARFCSDVIVFDDLPKSETTFADFLVEHGVEAIVARVAHRPEVLDIGTPRAGLSQLVEHEQQRKQPYAPGAPVTYLYPPEKGWVRMDPTAPLDNVSIIDLAVLVDDPGDLATMLLRLTGEAQGGTVARAEALEQKFSDVATLFAALDPRLARVMFEKLSRAVLELEPERRTTMLKRTILPGLLDGRAEGAVLRDFPDVDLAESLCMLLELETAAPELLTSALGRLDLPAERREAIGPLIDAQLKRGRGDVAATEAPDKEKSLDHYARQLIRIDTGAQKNFSEFTAFDLSIDQRTAESIAGVGAAIDATDLPLAQLHCLCRLTRIEPNPSVVDGFLRRGLGLLTELEGSARWTDLMASVSEYGQISKDLLDARPDVAESIDKALRAFCGPDRALMITELHTRGEEGHQLAASLTASFGTALVPAFVTLLDDPAIHPRIGPLVPLMCEHAALLAPALAMWLGECGPGAARAIVRVLGFAGTGYESTIAATLERDEQTRREALRALARIGTAQAASLVARQVRAHNASARSAAEEALWHFDPAQTADQLRELLQSRDFVVQNPQTVVRLLDRAAKAGTKGLDQALGELEGLRFRFWNPALVRVALKARELRGR
jgi:hypothetical protein